MKFIEQGLKIKKLKLGEDFIIYHNKIVLNPCLILKHDPEISLTYYLHVYKQLCQ